MDRIKTRVMKICNSIRMAINHEMDQGVNFRRKILVRDMQLEIFLEVLQTELIKASLKRKMIIF